MKKISIPGGNSLQDLEWSVWEPVGFVNYDYDPVSPFLLGRVRKLERVSPREHTTGVRLKTEGAGDQYWNFEAIGNILALFSPRENVLTRCSVPFFPLVYSSWEPNCSVFKRDFYFVEHAYSGKEAVIEGLRVTGCDLDKYAEWIESGRFSVERNTVGRLAERVGFGRLLPEIPAIKGYALRD